MNSIIKKIEDRIEYIKRTVDNSINMKYYINGYENTAVKLINYNGHIGPVIKTMISDAINTFLYTKRDELSYYYYTRGIINACMFVAKTIREENGWY